MRAYLRERPLFVVVWTFIVLIITLVGFGFVSRAVALDELWLIPIHMGFVLFAVMSLAGGVFTTLGVIRGRLPWWHIAVALFVMVLTGITIFLGSLFFLFSLVGFS
jgi:hypothetical protein